MLGRGLQPDPLGVLEGPSLYTYVKNSPLMGTDPQGLQPTPPPPSNIPGGPWNWRPNPGNSRGGTWVGQGGHSGTWDPEGHWAGANGSGDRQRYNRFGAPISADDAHGDYKGSSRRP